MFDHTHALGKLGRRWPALLLLPLLTAATPVRSARAEDEGSSTETAAARMLALEGMKLADAGRCSEAVDKLLRAEKLHHAPIVLSRLGECQVATGKVVDGTESMRRVLREPLPPNASPALVKAREKAQATLDAAKPRIAALTISVRGPRENEAVVTVDGKQVASVLLDADRPTDPGEHVVEATAPGYLKASARVSVGPGEKQVVTIELEPDPKASASAAAAAPNDSGKDPRANSRPAAARDSSPLPPSDPSLSASQSAANHTLSYVSWAVGGAALGVGAGFGLAAMKGKSDLDGQCRSNVCPPSTEDKLNSANRAGTISTVLFGVGALGAVLGTVFYFTASPSTATAGTPRAFVGAGRVGLSGTF